MTVFRWPPTEPTGGPLMMPVPVRSCVKDAKTPTPFKGRGWRAWEPRNSRPPQNGFVPHVHRDSNHLSRFWGSGLAFFLSLEGVPTRSKASRRISRFVSTYTSVDLRFACPRIFLIVMGSIPAWSRCMAFVCLSVWGLMPDLPRRGISCLAAARYFFIT